MLWQKTPAFQLSETWESISNATVRQTLPHQTPNSLSCNKISEHLPPLLAFTFILVRIGVRKSWCLSCLPAEKAPEVWTSLVLPTFLHRVALSAFLNKDLLACFSISHFVLRWDLKAQTKDNSRFANLERQLGGRRVPLLWLKGMSITLSKP